MRDSGLAAAWRALLSPEVGSTATSFEEYRSDVLRSRLAAIAWATLFGGVLFRLVLIITRPEQWFAEWPVMLVTLALPAGLVLARHTRLAHAPDVLILGAYLIYIGAGLTRAFMPTAFTSGIAAEELERIFEPFQQGRDGRGRAGSAGLGLYVVARLSAALGGSVSAESQVGRGTTFRVVLPSAPGA